MQNSSLMPDGARGPGAGLRRSAWRAMVGGFALGALLFICANNLGLLIDSAAFPAWSLPACGIAGALVARSRARRIPWVLGLCITLASLVTVYTPLFDRAIAGMVRQDPIGRADAVVLLTADIGPDSNMTAEVLARLIYACEPLQRRLAAAVVMTRPAERAAEAEAAARRGLSLMAVQAPLLQTGAVRSLHDEATALAALAHERGWRRFIVLCPHVPSRRIGAVLEKAGLEVCTLPYGMFTPPGKPGERVGSLGTWLREGVLLRYYRLRGWA